MGKQLHMTHVFDTTQPILETLINESKDDFISDNLFADICEAYELEEDDVMEMMLNCDSGSFERHQKGENHGFLYTTFD